MYEKNVRRKRRAVLAALVIASVVLLTVSFGETPRGGLHALQRGAQEVLTPIQSGASRVLKPLRDAVGWVGDALAARQENERLRDEVARLRQGVAATATDRRDAEQLRALVGLTDARGFPRGVDPLTARVIGRSPNVWYSALQIDKGTGDGVEVDQPVIAGGGLVGRVSYVSAGAARVTLITDRSSAVSAQAMPRGAAGIVRPNVGNSRDLLLDFIEKGRKVKRGDTVVTSGAISAKFESLFPRGIPIGRVRPIDSSDFELYQRVHIEPFADLSRMDFVQVLKMGERSERAQVAR